MIYLYRFKINFFLKTLTMKRIRSKEKTKKIVSQKRISSRISNNIQREEDLQTFNLQNITNPFSLYDKDNSIMKNFYQTKIRKKLFMIQ